MSVSIIRNTRLRFETSNGGFRKCVTLLLHWFRSSVQGVNVFLHEEQRVSCYTACETSFHLVTMEYLFLPNNSRVKVHTPYWRFVGSISCGACFKPVLLALTRRVLTIKETLILSYIDHNFPCLRLSYTCIYNTTRNCININLWNATKYIRFGVRHTRNNKCPDLGRRVHVYKSWNWLWAFRQKEFPFSKFGSPTDDLFSRV